MSERSLIRSRTFLIRSNSAERYSDKNADDRYETRYFRSIDEQKQNESFSYDSLDNDSAKKGRESFSYATHDNESVNRESFSYASVDNESAKKQTFSYSSLDNELVKKERESFNYRSLDNYDSAKNETFTHLEIDNISLGTQVSNGSFTLDNSFRLRFQRIRSSLKMRSLQKYYTNSKSQNEAEETLHQLRDYIARNKEDLLLRRELLNRRGSSLPPMHHIDNQIGNKIVDDNVDNKMQHVDNNSTRNQSPPVSRKGNKSSKKHRSLSFKEKMQTHFRDQSSQRSGILKFSPIKLFHRDNKSSKTAGVSRSKSQPASRKSSKVDFELNPRGNSFDGERSINGASQRNTFLDERNSSRASLRNFFHDERSTNRADERDSTPASQRTSKSTKPEPNNRGKKEQNNRDKKEANNWGKKVAKSSATPIELPSSIKLIAAAAATLEKASSNYRNEAINPAASSKPSYTHQYPQASHDTTRQL